MYKKYSMRTHEKERIVVSEFDRVGNELRHIISYLRIKCLILKH